MREDAIRFAWVSRSLDLCVNNGHYPRALPSPGKENWPRLVSEHDKNKPRQWETGDLGQGLHIKNLGLALIH